MFSNCPIIVPGLLHLLVPSITNPQATSYALSSHFLIVPLLEHDHELKESYQKMVVDPIHHSRRPCGGLYRDIKKLTSRFVSDFKDGLNLQVLVSIFFIYISFVAPAIAFGGLMEEVTNNYIGESETLLGAGFGGIVFGLLAVQPLTVLAFVGPVLVYESIIYRVCLCIHVCLYVCMYV